MRLQALDCFFLVTCLALMARLIFSLKKLNLILQSSDLNVVLVCEPRAFNLELLYHEDHRLHVVT